MMLRHIFSIITTILITTTTGSLQAQENSGKLYLRDFSGACNGQADDDYWGKTLGWIRLDLPWGHLETKKGQWDDAKLEKWAQDHVLKNKQKNTTCLPILNYNTDWSTEKKNWSFEYAGESIEYTPLENGRYIKRIFTQKKDGTLTLTLTLTLKEEKEIDHHSTFPLDNSHVPDWENYVRRVVTKLMAPPYNLKYFQIWNEAHPQSGFYQGSLDSYMERVHLPAAKIIQEMGGKVVYGGWPCCGSLSEYTNLLDKYEAWPTIDVHDVHYFPVSAYAYLYREAQKRGIKHPFIWQTEYGFTTNPVSLANAYPRILDWALRQNPIDKDQFKVFWFANWSPDDPKAYGYMHSLFAGERLTGNGSTLKVLGDLFNNQPIERYTAYTTSPKLIQTEIDERLSGIESLKAGNRIVLVIHLSANNTAKLFTDWQGDGDTIHLDAGEPTIKIELSQLTAKQITAAYRVDLEGQKVEILSSMQAADAGITLKAPIRDAKDSKAHEWNNASDRPRTFFVQIDLAVQ